MHNQADREKLILAIGNTPGVAQVDDLLTVDAPPLPAASPRWRARTGCDFVTVNRGDTLSAIAKPYYKDASKYPGIFDANRPMLGDPNKIYLGQVLRIPPEA